VYREAALRAVEVMPLCHYYREASMGQNALVLGFAAVRPAAIRAGVSRLALAIDAARRQRAV
jgi:DNA-binding transcriptional MocR family regulator